jgi:hypothetical protein
MARKKTSDSKPASKPAAQTDKTYSFTEFLHRTYPNIASRVEAALSSDDGRFDVFKRQFQEAHQKKQT